MSARPLAPQRWSGPRWRLWREWCFWRAVALEMGPRLALLGVILLVGGLAFQKYEPERRLDLVEAMFQTWSLVFGQAPESLPASAVLRVLFFVVPVIGLGVVIESIVELSQMLRDRQRSEQSWSRIMASSMQGHTVLVGLGRLGYRAFTLLRAMGRRVVVVDADAQNHFLDQVREDGSPILIGDARREALLAEANVGCAESVVVVTDSDLANLEIALDARRMAPNVRVVVRVFDQELAEKVSASSDISCAMSQASLSAPAFVMAAIAANTDEVAVVGGRLATLQWVTVDEESARLSPTIGALAAGRRAAAVRAVSPDGATLEYPAFDLPLRAGWRVLLQTEPPSPAPGM